tara:strand:+ start:466 stop:1758 length:1293 start_codon:yes stop_codon:yes gene_type:complete
MASLNNFIEEHFKLLIVIILALSFFVAILGIVFATNCSLGDAEECMLSKENILPDFYWHYNTIKYVAASGEFPYSVPGGCDGGPNGDFGEDDKTTCGPHKEMYHSPLYYFVGAGIFKLSNIFNLNSLITLHVLSVFIALITNLIFLLLLIELARNYRLDKKFIIFALAIFTFLPVHLFYSVMIYDGVLFYPFLIATIYMFVRFSEKPNLRNSIFLGVVTGFSLLSFLAGIMSLIALGILLIILYLRKKYYKAKFLFLSIVVGSIIGSYPIIRNTIVYGNPMGPFLAEYIVSNTDLTRLPLYYRAFWGGVYGGLDQLFIPLVIITIILSIATIYSIIKNYKKASSLNLMLFIGVITLAFLFQMTCNVFTLLKTGTCIGTFGHGKYLVSLNPIIAIFSSMVLINIQKFKTLIVFLVILIFIVFGIDFLFAFR